MVRYITGDATQPIFPATHGTRIIAHVCNNVGRWGRGFVLALSERWPWLRKVYRSWYAKLPPERQVLNQTEFSLGGVQLVNVGYKMYVANLVAQSGIRPLGNQPPIRYDALQECLDWLGDFAEENFDKPSIHSPRIGCGLAGGEWSRVLEIIGDTIDRRGIQFLVYDLPGSKNFREA